MATKLTGMRPLTRYVCLFTFSTDTIDEIVVIFDNREIGSDEYPMGIILTGTDPSKLYDEEQDFIVHEVDRIISLAKAMFTLA